MALPKNIDIIDKRIKLDVDKAMKLRTENKLSYEDIGKNLGVTKQAVHQALSPLLKDKEETELYKKDRGDIFANMQARLLTKLDGEVLDKMSGRDLVIATGVLYDKERLERGQSTQNVSLLHRLIEESPDLPE